MPTPKRKHSHRRTHLRYAQWVGELRAPNLTACTHCGEMIPTYSACPVCGYYRGRKVIKVAADKNETAENSETTNNQSE